MLAVEMVIPLYMPDSGHTIFHPDLEHKYEPVDGAYNYQLDSLDKIDGLDHSD